MANFSNSKFHKLFFKFSFVFLGFLSLIIQTIFLRELIATLYGHEFFVGIILASWLIWVAIGSLVANRYILKSSVFKLLNILPLLISFILLAEILLLRYLKSFLGFAGEIPNLLNGILIGILLPLPICFFLGNWWTLATRYFSILNKNIATVSLGYFWETLGFILGGLLLSFALVYSSSFLVIFLLIFLSFFFSLFLFRYSIFQIGVACILGILLFALNFYAIETLELKTQSFRFKNQNLLASSNSKYGNLSVTQAENQINFYQNGILVGSTQTDELIEEKIHFPLLAHPKPEKILLIGGGISGTLHQALKHPVKTIYYVELDPKLIEIGKKFLPNEIRQDFEDKKVKLIFQDGFYFLKTTNQKFDIIIFNLPEPSNLLINRFYTKEFFEITKARLKEEGIFTFTLPYSLTSPNPNLYFLNGLIYHTLKDVYPEVRILSEYANLFLASSNQINLDPQNLLERFQKRNLQTRFFSREYLKYRLTSPRNAIVEESLKKFQKTNLLTHPLAYFYQTLFWLDRLNPKMAQVFSWFTSSIFWSLILVLFLIIIWLYQKKEKLNLKLSCLSMATAGFSIMSLEMILLLSYQSSVGHLYTKVSLIISAVMLGLALGTWHGKRVLSIKQNKSVVNLLKKSHLSFAVFGLVLILLSFYLFTFPNWLVEVIVLILGIIAGYLGGFIFPLTNKIYLENYKEKTGTIYSADLIGSAFGAILPSLILVPYFGFFISLGVLIILNCFMIGILFLVRK